MDSCHNISAAEDIEMLDMDERLRQVVVRGHLVVDAAEQARAVRALNSDILGQIDICMQKPDIPVQRSVFI